MIHSSVQVTLYCIDANSTHDTEWIWLIGSVKTDVYMKVRDSRQIAKSPFLESQLWLNVITKRNLKALHLL
jgi:hypothetical protein